MTIWRIRQSAEVRSLLKGRGRVRAASQPHLPKFHAYGNSTPAPAYIFTRPCMSSWPLRANLLAPPAIPRSSCRALRVAWLRTRRREASHPLIPTFVLLESFAERALHHLSPWPKRRKETMTTPSISGGKGRPRQGRSRLHRTFIRYRTIPYSQSSHIAARRY